jgi:hypothetical protein
MSETSNVFVRKEYKGGDVVLVPATNLDRDFLSKYPPHTLLKCKITRPRSGAHHRLFFGLLHLVVENQERYRTVDELLMYVKTALGYVEKIVFHDGTHIFVTQSIAFDKMGQDEFREFFDKAVDLIIAEVLPGVSRKTLIKNVEKMLGVSSIDLHKSEEEREDEREHRDEKD